MDQWGQCCRWWESDNIQFGSTTEETTIVFEMREFGGAAYAHLELHAVQPLRDPLAPPRALVDGLTDLALSLSSNANTIQLKVVGTATA